MKIVNGVPYFLVELTPSQWNTVVNLLAEVPAPYKLTDPLIREILKQTDAQQPRAAPPPQSDKPAAPSPDPPFTPNGFVDRQLAELPSAPAAPNGKSADGA